MSTCSAAIPLRLLASVAAFVATAVPVLPEDGVAQETEEIRARMEYDRLRLYSGFGVNLSDLLQNARQRVQAMRGGGPLPMSLMDTRWRASGPDRIDERGLARAGRVSAIAIHPRDPGILYVGAAQGGVWRSDNAGVSWTPLTDGECSLAMGSVAIDPVNPDIVYAGTGEQHFSGDSYYGCGVLRSVNGGATWTQLGADVFVRKSYRSGGARISRVLIDPATAGSPTSTTVLAATTFGLFRSAASGRSWTQVLDGIATDLVRHPEDPSILYAAVRADGVYRSSDGGVSWTRASAGLPDTDITRINLAIAPSAPDVLYAGIVNYGEGREQGSGLLMFRTNDGAETWQHVAAAGAQCYYQCWYDMTLAVHPQDSENVYFGSIRMFRSEDGGHSFSELGDSYVDTYVDQHLLVFDTLSGPDVLYLTNDGGVHRSMDAGVTWASLATNLAVAQFYSGISAHPSDPAVTLGGTQDHGTLLSSAGTSVWAKVLRGDGGFTAFDAEDPDVWYAEMQWRAGKGNSGPRKNGRLAVAGIDRGERALFIPPLIMDPVDSRRLYFGAERLYRTDDAAESWKPVFEGSEDGVISAIALTPADPNTVYMAITLGRVAVTRDGGLTWSHAEAAAGLPERYITDMAAHPTDPDQAYAVAGGFLTGHVFQTTDGGRSWRDRSGDLPDLPVNAVLYDPVDPNGVYVGTDLGVFHSAGGGGSWEPLDDNLPKAAVFDLAAQPGTGRLVAATHGRGMFEVPIAVPLTARVRPVALADTMIASPDSMLAGEVIVAPHGRDDYAAAWEATADVPWLTLEGATGQGRDRFTYRYSGTGLSEGDNEATVTVTVAGAADPVTIPVTLHAVLPSHLALAVSGMRVAVLVGSTEPFADSVGVVFSGPRQGTEWTASHTGGDWIELTRTSGAGDGAVTWKVDPTGLAVGLYVDTVTVVGYRATGSPAVFVDTLAVQPPLRVADARDVTGYGVSRWQSPSGDSLSAGLIGFGAEDAVWTAQSAGSEWLVLDRATGGYGEQVVWTRLAESLDPGVYEDTITIRVQGRPALSGVIVDRFEVVEEIGVEEAVHHLLGLELLAPVQIGFLDWFGNGDGDFNAGDVLRWFDHCAAGGEGSGCAPASGTLAEPGQPLPGRQP